MIKNPNCYYLNFLLEGNENLAALQHQTSIEANSNRGCSGGTQCRISWFVCYQTHYDFLWSSTRQVMATFSTNSLSYFLLNGSER